MKLPVRSFATFILYSLFFIFFFVSPAYVSAQGINSYSAPNTNPDVPANLHTWTQSVMIDVTSAMVCQITGVDPTNKQGKCLGVDTQTGKIGYTENGGGAIGFMGNMIAVLYTPPLHTSDYTTYLSQNFGIVKPAYAQGVGFTGLKPLLNLWVVFRNIVYLFFVAVFIIIGFAIMLRIKIDPRTVMTIGNQLPKIIVSLLLVTFSFAIAGFVVDIMYVATFVTANVISSAEPTKEKQDKMVTVVNKELYTPPIGFANQLLDDDTDSGVGGVLDISWNAGARVQQLIQSIFSPSQTDWVKVGASTGGIFDGNACPQQDWVAWTNCRIGVVIPSLGGAIANSVASALGFVISWGLGALAFLVVAIAILFAMFRLWFQLISAYVYFLIDVVFAPFWIIAGLIPGSPISFTAWIQDMLGNLSAFPVTIGMFLLGKVFIDSFAQAQPASSLFLPPLIGNPSVENTLGPIIGLGIILMTPAVVTMTRDLLKSPAFKYTSAIGQSLGFAAGAGKNIATSAGLGLYGKGKYEDKGWSAVARKAFGI